MIRDLLFSSSPWYAAEAGTSDFRFSCGRSDPACKDEILVQNIYSLETLAHVDTICLDKTGTITDGS